MTDDIESDVLAIWRSFSLRIYNDPGNLKLHTQRLLFGLDNDLSEYVTGALQDLFVCLQQKGLPLRQRLFNLLSPIMVQSERVYFQEWLADNSDNNLKCHRFLGAVFKSETCQPVDGLDENFALENKKFGNNSVFNSQLDEALYNLECGQIKKAKAMLENICLKNDENSLAINELQSLYTLTKDREGLENFTQCFTDNNKVLTEVWSNLLKATESW